MYFFLCLYESFLFLLSALFIDSFIILLASSSALIISRSATFLRYCTPRKKHTAATTTAIIITTHKGKDIVSKHTSILFRILRWFKTILYSNRRSKPGMEIPV